MQADGIPVIILPLIHREYKFFRTRAVDSMEKTQENEMFVCICKVRLEPKQALRVSKSQLLAPADGLAALLVGLTRPAQRMLRNGFCC